jgi:hypothetical protein
MRMAHLGLYFYIRHPLTERRFPPVRNATLDRLALP